MSDFTALDWFWTGAFLLLMVGGAFFSYRLARRSESDFFLAGRGLPWWLPASCGLAGCRHAWNPTCLRRGHPEAGTLGNQWRVAMQTRHTESITGTSTNTPTTVASAAPDPGP